MTRRAPNLVAGLLLAAVTLGACGDNDAAAPATTLASTTTTAPSDTQRTISTAVAGDSSAAGDDLRTDVVGGASDDRRRIRDHRAGDHARRDDGAGDHDRRGRDDRPRDGGADPGDDRDDGRAPRPVAPPPPRANEAHVEVGTIEIPKIGIVKPMLEGISLNTLDKAPGHWPGTAMPGQPGNVVVAGHRTSKDRPFRHIDQLVAGDEVIFTTADGRFVYRVIDTQIVLPDAMWIVGQTPASTATLFACHPVGSTKERIVVFLQLET